MGEDMKNSINVNNVQFIIEQYSQYWQMYRFHLSLSWNIPSLAVVALIAIFGLDPDKFSKWLQEPLIPALAFLLASIFIFVLIIHHRRNLKFAHMFEPVLEKMEKDYGTDLRALHHRTKKRITGIDKISSSACLFVFLLVLLLVFVCFDAYFWIEVL